MKKFLLVFLVFILNLPAHALISDDFVEETLSKELRIRTYTPPVIRDEFAEANTNKSQAKLVVKITEVLPKVEGIPNRRKTYKISDKGENRVELSIKNPITTKIQPVEGSFIEFETISPVNYGNKSYPAGTVVRARVETVSMNNTWGTPADLVIGNFSIDGKPLYGEIYKTGSNRSLWVKPVSYVSTPFFGAGFLFMLIRGGHAKIEPHEIFTVYY